MRVLVAPDKFRGTLTAEEAAAAIADGWRRVRPADAVDACPIADGGEGTMRALLGALGGSTVAERVAGPDGSPVPATFGLAVRDGTTIAIVESAAASGLALVPTGRRDALRADTRGTGELLRAALDRDPDRVLLCLGGTASVDGGAGMVQALGVRLLRADGTPIGRGGAGLLDLASVDLSGLDPRLRGVPIEGCVDVETRLTGPGGAAATFGPQKGADPDQVLLLDRALAHLAAVVHRDLGIDLRDRPGTGAGGGAAFGAVAFLGARLRRGAEVVADAVGLERRTAAADLVLTGEGRFDRTSLAGKAPGRALRVAAAAGVPATVLCGEAEPGIGEAVDGTVRVVSLVDAFGREAATTQAGRCLREAAASLAERIEGADGG